jgi:hypothetical protein
MNEIKCEHHNWIPAGYRQGEGNIRVQSLYEVYCLDCGHFINLLTNEILDDQGLSKEGGVKNDI